MKIEADKKRTVMQFEVGEKMYLKLQLYKQQSLTKRPYEKLAARYYGPFEVVARFGAVAYKLDLPDYCKIHPLFHVPQLKGAFGDGQENPLPANLTQELELQVSPAMLLDVKSIHEKHGDRKRFIIQWEGMSSEDATWEDSDTIAALFPHFHLEDKLNLWPVGIVTNWAKPPVVQTYHRKMKKNETKKRDPQQHMAKESDDENALNGIEGVSDVRGQHAF